MSCNETCTHHHLESYELFSSKQGLVDVTPQQPVPCLALQVMMSVKKITKIMQKKIRLAQLVILK
jgi:hypothetical protein